MWYGTGFLGIQLVGSGGYVPKPIQDDNFLNGLPANWTYGSTVSSTDLLWDDYPGRVWNDYGVGVPRIIPGKGLLFESGRNNRFLNSAAPANHTTASVPVGLYIVWMNGFGSLTVAGGTAAGTGFGTATQGVPIWVNVTTAGTVIVTVSGLVYAIQMEAVGTADQAVPTSFIRTTVGAVGRGNIYLTCPVPAGFNLAQCTYFIEWQPLNSLIVNSRLIEVSGTAGSAVDYDRVIYTSGTALRGTTASNSAIQGNAIPTTVVNMGLIHRAAYSVKVGAAVLGIDGDVPTAVAQSARPVDLITIALMNAAAGNVPVQGYLRAFKYWPTAANAEQVQVMTQPDIPIPTWDDTFYGKIPAPFVFSRTSVATDLVITDPPGRVWNDFPVQTPRFSSQGLLMENGKNTWFPLSATPATVSTSTALSVRVMTFWFIGTGTCTISAGTGVCDPVGPCNPGVAYAINVTTAGTLVFTFSGTPYVAQLEQQDSLAATSPSTFMRNVGANAARSIENVQALGVPWLNPIEDTSLIEFTPTNNAVISSQRALAISGTVLNNDQERLFTSGGVPNVVMAASTISNALSSTRLDYTGYTMFTPYKMCISRNTSKVLQYVVNGVLVATASNATAPVDLKDIAIMGLVGNNVTNYGYVRRFTYWNKALTTDQMIKVTT